MSTLEEVKQCALDAKESIWEQAKAYDRDPKIYLHWSAGTYDNHSDHYHVCIDGEGGLHIMHPDMSDVVQGTWKRNSGSVSIAMSGCYGAGSSGLGDYPPTEAQIEAMAQCIQVIADALDLTIDKNHVLTHGEAANNEDGDERWHRPYAWWNDSYGDGDTRGDLEYLGTKDSPSYNPEATDGTRGGDVERGKANFYRNKARGEEQ